MQVVVGLHDLDHPRRLRELQPEKPVGQNPPPVSDPRHGLGPAAGTNRERFGQSGTGTAVLDSGAGVELDCGIR